jgi:DNA-binding NarL/FixJ family response regulator
MVRCTLERNPNFIVCSEAEDGAEAIEKAKSLKPDVVVLNIGMPIANGFEAARKIKASMPETAIVILSSHADQEFIEEAKTIGCQAYVLKTEVSKELVRAIERAVEREDSVVMP